MKLLLITGDFPPVQSGEAAHAFHLGLNLAKRGIDVHILTSVMTKVVNHPKLTVHPIMSTWSWAGLPRFAAFLRRCSPDAVLLMFLGEMYDFHPMMTFAPTISKFINSSVPFVTQFEYAPGRTWMPSFWSRAVRKTIATWVTGARTDYAFGTLLRDSNHVIALNDNHRVELNEHLSQPSRECLLIPPPPFMELRPDEANAERAQGRASLGVKDDDFLFIYYGYIYPGKGIETLLHSIQFVAEHRPRVRLAIVGGFLEHFFAKNSTAINKSYAEQVQQLPQRLGITNNVIWTGPCPSESEQARLYLRAADACILPFDRGIQLNNSSFAAAAAHGLPIITTQGESLEQWFVHNQNVLLCPPKDAKPLADAISSLMDSPDLCRHLSMGALQLTEKWFSWEGAVKRTLAAFDHDYQSPH